MAGLSQGQVSRMLGYHRPTISGIEAGSRRVRAEELDEFARIYDVDVDWILGIQSNSVEDSDPKVQLAARELGKLSDEDLGRVLKLVSALKSSQRG